MEKSEQIAALTTSEQTYMLALLEYSRAKYMLQEAELKFSMAT